MDGITSFAILVALNVGLVEVLKRAVKLEKRYTPLVAVICGMVLTFLGSVAKITSLDVLTGIATGLSSCGLFDQYLLVKKIKK